MTIEQTVEFDANPERIYRILTDPEEFAAVTGAPAQFTAEEGAPFSGFGDQITGRFIELVAGERVVMAWRVGGWEPGQYSLVTYTLESAGTGTRLHLRQAGYPDDAREHLEPGWFKMYWDPIKEHTK